MSLINKRVGKTDSVALTSGKICDYRHIQTVTVASVCTCQAHCLCFSFFYKCTTDLDQARAPVTISWAQAPYPGAPLCTLTTFNGTVHACICTKDKNNFLVTFFAITLYHFLYILY